MTGAAAAAPGGGTEAVAVPQYHTNLRAPLRTVVGPEPAAKVHAAEIRKVCDYCV